MKKIIKKIIIAFAIIAAVFAAISLLDIFNAFGRLENISYDLRARLFADSKTAHDDIIVILLDNQSIEWAQNERGWGWPWPREAYAEILEFLNMGEAKSVAFDVIYSEPSIYRNARQNEIIDNAQAIDDISILRLKEDDAVFVRAAQEYGRAVQGIKFGSKAVSPQSWPQGLNKPFFETKEFGSFITQYSLSEDGEIMDNALFPIEELRDSAGALASLTGIPDHDDIFRRLRLFTLFDGKAVPSLAAASLLVSGCPSEIIYDPDNNVIIWKNIPVYENWELKYVTREIPVDENGASLLRYRSSLDRYFPFSAKDILTSLEAVKNDEEPIFYPEDFTDRYVFFGFWAEGLYDVFSTPVSQVYPGMGVHITMLDNILSGDFIHESRQWLNYLILLAGISLAVFLCLFTSRVYFSVAGLLIAIPGIITAAFIAYNNYNIWLLMIMPLTGVLIAYITATIYSYATEGSQKRFIKSAFSQYLSPKVIEQIIANPSQLKLGGEKRQMTAIFTDIRAFSTFSEALGDPAKLVELLNHYLTNMSNIILENQGTIDKYIGDAIVSFFGAPVYFADHAKLACRSAVLMKRAEKEINRQALEQGLLTEAVLKAMFNKGIIKSMDDPCPIFTRIGVNTGEMVVGNMGTPTKMDYTIMGNAVNLTARLEGVNSQYNTGGILLSEYTKDLIGDDFLLRPLSRVRVVGINTPLRLYELLDIKTEAKPEMLEMVKSWERGFAAYEAKDFLASSNIFGAIYMKNPVDLCAKKYYDRSKEYISTPPDESVWDGGVDNLTKK